MPFAQYKQPSIGLSLLKAELAQRGLSARVLYPNLRFAGKIGAGVYERIATWYLTDLLGDWLFSRALFGCSQDDDGYLEKVLRGGNPAHTQAYFGKQPLDRQAIRELLAARESVPGFLQDCAREILAMAPKIVGFTSQFHQHTASLALARLLKEQDPGLFVVGGGANFRGPMGQEAVRQFSYLDAVVSGEADIVFSPLADRILSGESVHDLPGVFTRENLDTRPEQPLYAPMTETLDLLPPPDTSDFEAAWQVSEFAQQQIPRYLLETTRGCWWGTRQRCLFCGQASAQLAFRSKSAERAVQELTALSQAHPDSAVIITDEIINPRYFQTFLPEVTRRRLGAKIVYFEVRPDLTKQQLTLLRQAGTQRVEVGIESLSSPILRLIHKGASALQCLQFLKWCRELEIAVVWNWLWGFPGEPAQEYKRLAKILPNIFHLAPPNYVGPFRLDRFSPYFESPQENHLADIAVYPAYHWVYPLPEDALQRLAYFFTYRTEPRQEVDRYTEPLAEQIVRWKANYPQSVLAFVDEGQRLVLMDRRNPTEEESHTALDGLHRTLYLACDRAQTAAELARTGEQETGESQTPETVRALLTPLVEQGWMAQEGDCYLSLAYRRVPSDCVAQSGPLQR
jgi:ribosomal peptide maturation radical SAM protein 1